MTMIYLAINDDDDPSLTRTRMWFWTIRRTSISTSLGHWKKKDMYNYKTSTIFGPVLGTIGPV